MEYWPKLFTHSILEKVQDNIQNSTIEKNDTLKQKEYLTNLIQEINEFHDKREQIEEITTQFHDDPKTLCRLLPMVGKTSRSYLSDDEVNNRHYNVSSNLIYIFK
ncbi:MAG: hypothetical protein LEGION0398_MBIBDBAK_00783 [Legionellaceae bacterium]